MHILNPAKLNYQIDELQHQMLQRYIQDDINFRRAFYTDLSPFFSKYMQDKIRLKEPITLSIIGQTRSQRWDSYVLKSDGVLTEIKDIHVGDELVSVVNGKIEFCKVLHERSWFCKDMYDVFNKRNKELLFSVAYNHLIPLRVRAGNYVRRYVIKDFTPLDLLKKKKSTTNAFRLVRSPPVFKFRGRENATVDAYSLGAYLGDGHCINILRKNRNAWNRQLGLTLGNECVAEKINKVYPYIVKRAKNPKNNCFVYSWSTSSKFFTEINKYGLQNIKAKQKFIPKDCLYSDMEYRKELLAGLLDTDGNLNRTHLAFTTSSKRLAEGVKYLVNSLGGQATLSFRRKKGGLPEIVGRLFDSYNINISLREKLPMTVPHKKMPERELEYNYAQYLGFVIKKGKPAMVKSIEVDSPSNYYLTNEFIITHNSGKSTNAIYLAGKVKELMGEELQPYNICSSEYEFLENLKKCKKNDFFVIDESKKAVFGVGSVAKKLKLLDVQNIIAVNNISTIWLRPDRWSFENANYGLRLYGRCFDSKPRYNRCMLYNLMASGKGGEFPMGMIYIPHYEETLKAGKKIDKWYREKKQKWVDKEQTGEGDMMYKYKMKMARKLATNPKFTELKKKQKIAYISATLGSEWTRTEAEEIVNISDLIKQGVMK